MNKFFSRAVLQDQVARKNFWILAGITLLGMVVIWGLFSLNNQVRELETTELGYNTQLVKQLEQANDIAAIQIEFKNQVQEWKDILLRGHNPDLNRKYWQQFEQSETRVRKGLEELHRELLVLENTAQEGSQLTPSVYPTQQQSSLEDLQNRSLTALHFSEKVAVLIDAHALIGKIYRDYLDRYSLLASANNAFVIDQQVRGMDRWLSEQLLLLRNETVANQESLTARTNLKQEQEIHELRLRTQHSITFVLLALLLNLFLIFDRLRSSSQELSDANKKSAAAIYELAYSDGLTNLPNRRLFLDKLDQTIALSRNTGHCGGLIFLDLDNFKTLNDAKGHAQGDLLLIEVAQRLRNSVRASDTVARLGGDEFVIILDGLRGDLETAAEQAGQIAEKICAALANPYQLKSYLHHGGASLGVALFQRGETDSEELLKQADIAMYQAKRAGRNTVRFYDRDTHIALTARSDLESNLYSALDQHQMNLHYQVQVDRNHQPAGVEALLRWQHPELGLLYPQQFIPLAEESDLIVMLGNWVLHTACAQLKQWEASPLTRDLTLSINVSAAQLRQSRHVSTQNQKLLSTSKLIKPSFIEQVQTALLRSGINPARLILEITESLALHDMQHTAETLLHLKSLGVSIAMDDFGTGHSALSYLKRLPIDQIKIDQSFVQDIDTDNYDQAIVKSIIDMALGLNIAVLAEGVETAAQEATLSALGCQFFQGHLFGEALPAQQCTDYLERHAA